MRSQMAKAIDANATLNTVSVPLLDAASEEQPDGAAAPPDAERDRLISPKFEALYRRHYDQAYRFACASLRGDGADDAVQIVFKRVWLASQRNPAYLDQPEHELAAIIIRATRNECHTMRRGVQRFVRRAAVLKRELQRQFEGVSTPPWRGIVQQELRDVMRREVWALPRKCGEVFRLARWGGWSYASIAVILEISPATVHQHLCKANTILRKRLVEYREPDGGWPIDPDVQRRMAPPQESDDND